MRDETRRVYSAPANLMEDARKYAYRHLLYLAMNDIRSVGGLVDPPTRLLDRTTSAEAMRWIARAGAIANWLENLAGFSADDFEGFDEDRFWREHARVCDQHPDVVAYLDWFQRRITEFGTGGCGTTNTQRTR